MVGKGGVEVVGFVGVCLCMFESMLGLIIGLLFNIIRLWIVFCILCMFFG